MNLLKQVEKTKSTWALIIYCFLYFILRIPSLFEPYWYGDEGITGVVGHGIRSGRLLYKQVWDNKPPLLYLVYALFDADQFSIRLMSILFGIGAVIVFFFLARRLFANSRSVFLSTFVFVLLFGLPTIEGNIANAENFMLLFSIAAGLLVYSYVEKKSVLKFPFPISHFPFFFAGILLGISFLFKIVAIFDFAAFFIFLLFTSLTGKIKPIINKRNFTKYLTGSSQAYVSGFILPVFLTFVYFFFKDTLSDYVYAAFGGNIGYVGWKNTFIIPQGLLLLKLFLLASVLTLLFKYRTFFSNPALFVMVWLAWSVFNTFFSGRPYTHYLLVTLPSVSLVFGFIFINRSIINKIALLLGIISLYFLLTYNFDYWNYSKTALYYNNFLTFIQNKKTTSEYRAFFDRNTPRDYLIAEYIKSHTKPHDTIFLWGNSAQIYTLSQTLPPGRYTVAYHIGTIKKRVAETEIAIKKTQPKYIIIMPNHDVFPFDLQNYSYRISIEDADIYEQSI